MLKISKTNKGVIIKIKVNAQSDEFAVAGFDPWTETLKIRVKSPAKKEKANLEIERELSRITGCKAIIKQGKHSSIKTIELIGRQEKAIKALESLLNEH